MRETARVVLFSEVNSKLGAPFPEVLYRHSSIDLAGVVTSPVGHLCSYFVNDAETVDIDQTAQDLGIPVYRPNTVKDSTLHEALKDVAPDYFIVGNF